MLDKEEEKQLSFPPCWDRMRGTKKNPPTFNPPPLRGEEI
jgi:hypothetical protein